MSKYDKMLELNKRKSEEKVERAVLTIRTMVLEREKVSVPALMQKTGLSRGFFYKNETVRKEMDRALEQQWNSRLVWWIQGETLSVRRWKRK